MLKTVAEAGWRCQEERQGIFRGPSVATPDGPEVRRQGEVPPIG